MSGVDSQNSVPVLWRPEDLGKPIGGSVHAISACLPTWRDVIGYEEGDPRVINALQCGYPRFFLHPLLQKLADHGLSRHGLSGGEFVALPYPGESSASRALDFLRHSRGIDARMVELSNPVAPVILVVVPRADEKHARYFWRITGEGMSSRAAEAVLAGTGDAPAVTTSSDSLNEVRKSLAATHGCDSADVFIFPSGMAAIYTLIRMAGTIVPGKPHAQIGFPYVDTWKDLECFTEAPLMQTGVTNAGIDRFFRESSNRGFGLVLCECPSNPLLESPDPRLLREHASAAGAILAIDDTVASSINIEALPFADVVTTSLSKWFNGRGDILAGALILNRNSPRHARMREFLGTEYQPELSHRDMEVLLKNSAGYRTRVRKAGFNAMKLAEMLRAHPRIDRVYTAAVDNSPAYASIARPDSTMPGLLSFTFRDETEHPMRFYDALSVCKGPSLGTDWTLACPYTLLAHYSELDWVRSCGVSPNLLRVSLGVEDTDDLLERFDRALTA